MQAVNNGGKSINEWSISIRVWSSRRLEGEDQIWIAYLWTWITHATYDVLNTTLDDHKQLAPRFT